MSYNYYMPGKTNPHLPHDGIELQPKSADAEAIEAAKRDADLLVSQLMTGKLLPDGEQDGVATTAPVATAKAQPRPGSHPVSRPVEDHPLLPSAEPVAIAAPAKAEDHAAPAVARKSSDTPIELCDEELVSQILKDAFPPLSEQEEIEPRGNYVTGAMQKVVSRVAPVAGIVAAAAICFFWPGVLLTVVAMAVVTFVSLTLSLKVPFLARNLHKAWQRYVDRAPERAERVRCAADKSAMVLERILDALPGAMADRLALPDMSKPVTPRR